MWAASVLMRLAGDRRGSALPRSVRLCTQGQRFFGNALRRDGQNQLILRSLPAGHHLLAERGLRAVEVARHRSG